MDKLKKGDLVWVAGPVDYPASRLTVEQLVVKSVGFGGRPYVIVESSSTATDHKVKIPRDRVSASSEEAILHARGMLRVAAAKLEEEARRLRATADAEPQIGLRAL